jgi:hypothetical protein
MVQTDFPADLGAPTIRLPLVPPALLRASVQMAMFGVVCGLCGTLSFPTTAHERLKVERVWTCWGLVGLSGILLVAASVKALAWRRLRGQHLELIAENGMLRLPRVAAWGPTVRTWRLDEISLEPRFITVWLRHKSGGTFPGGGLSLPAGWNAWLPRAMARRSNTNLLVMDAFATFRSQSSQMHALVLVWGNDKRVAAVCGDENELGPYFAPADSTEIWSFDQKSAALVGKILGKQMQQ